MKKKKHRFVEFFQHHFMQRGIGKKKKKKHTSQIGHALYVDLKLVTFEVFANESQQRVKDPHGSCYCGR